MYAFGNGRTRRPRHTVESCPRINRADIARALPGPQDLATWPLGRVAREGAAAVRINGVEAQIEIAWEAIQSRPYGWRIHLICGRCGAWRHHLYLRDGALACC